MVNPKSQSALEAIHRTLYNSQRNSRDYSGTNRFGNLTMDDEVGYICDNCGEEIITPIDPTAGSTQQYVEDCPVCCSPNVIHVEIDGDGDVQAWAQPEQDRY